MTGKARRRRLKKRTFVGGIRGAGKYLRRRRVSQIDGTGA